ncbi:EF-hand [Aulographum hederae CBS 113979]|uniref:EF-hand n=1 Tax=Aulographum hederae CBS 113979 TaxID=1176131 RepID=A0A6G1GLT6_9PEZI|nr:EF-hand [Aulographum hederae CBS 113979]
MASAPSSLTRDRFAVTLAVAAVTILGIGSVVYSQSQAAASAPLHRSNAVVRRRARTAVHNQDNPTDRVADTAEPVSAAAEPSLRDALSQVADTETGAGDMESIAPTEVTEVTEESFARDTQELANRQNLQQLLYRIAEERSRTLGRIHHMVSCSACTTSPIRGIRWHCLNCDNYNLCSSCDANSEQIHPRTHTFERIREPAPFLGPRTAPARPAIYPGDPALANSLALRPNVKKALMDTTEFDAAAIDGLWGNFTMYTDHRLEEDPSGVGGAISFRSFEKGFLPDALAAASAKNLCFDRIFDFYDANHDKIISFEEFVRGAAVLRGMEKESTKLRCIFRGYDIDGDGFVSRKDFLCIFQAYFKLQKILTHEYIESEFRILSLEKMSDLVKKSMPFASGFNHIRVQPNHLIGNPNRVAPRGPGIRRDADRNPRRDLLPHLWTAQRMENVDEKLRDRELKRTFYTDEEEGQSLSEASQRGFSERPKSNGRPVERCSSSPRAVRKDEQGLDTRARDDPLRWIHESLTSQDDNLFGDVVYQSIQEGMNSVLDELFKPLEDLALQVEASKADRRRWAREMQAFREKQEAEAAAKALQESEDAMDIDSDGASTDRTLNDVISSSDETKQPSLAARLVRNDDYSFPAEIAEQVDPMLPQRCPNTPPALPEYMLHLLVHLADHERVIRIRGPGRISFEEFERFIKARGADAGGGAGRPSEKEKTKFFGSWLEIGNTF